jgi:hypothetical protein
MKFDGVPALTAQIRSDIGKDRSWCCKHAHVLVVLTDMFEQMFAVCFAVRNVLVSLVSLLPMLPVLLALAGMARAQLALPRPQNWRDKKFFPGAKRPTKRRAQPKPAAAEQQAPEQAPPEQAAAEYQYWEPQKT